MSWLWHSPRKTGVFAATLASVAISGCWERTDESPGAHAPGRALEVTSPAQAAPPTATPIPMPAPTAAPPTAPDPPLVVVAGGDVNFGRECGQSILSDAKYDPFA